MSIDNLEDLQEIHLDVLTEIGNIGSGNAATALATLLNTFVDIQIPNIQLIDFDNISQILGGNESLALAMSIQLEGDLNGMMLHIIQKDFASTLINNFYECEIDTIRDLSEMDMSVLREMSNITCAAYVNSLASLTNMMINISPPSDHVDLVGNLLKVPLTSFHSLGSQALFIDETMMITNSEIKSHMILVLELESLKILFHRFGIH
ncbi:MAG: chemotaxis protein CheC [Lachnospiraceae bacterium]